MFESKNDDELFFVRSKAEKFIKIVNMNGYEILDENIKDEIFKEILESNNDQDLEQKVQEIKEQYNLN